MTGNNIMCGRRRNADRHCVTLLQLGSNYFYSSIRKSHEPIMPDNMCLSYSNCTIGKVYSHWLSSIYAFSLFFPSSVCMAHYSFKVEALKQFSVLWYHSLQLLCFDGKKKFDALNAERKISLDWTYSNFASLDNNIPMVF